MRLDMKVQKLTLMSGKVIGGNILFSINCIQAI